MERIRITNDIELREAQLKITDLANKMMQYPDMDELKASKDWAYYHKLLDEIHEYKDGQK